MRKILFLLALLSLSAYGDEYVNGYFRADGTYVAPHHRSSPNGYTFDNYSTQGNSNPYTGERGTERPQPADQYAPQQIHIPYVRPATR